MKHYIECEICGIFVNSRDVVSITRKNNKRKKFRYVEMCPECWESFNFPIRTIEEKHTTN